MNRTSLFSILALMAASATARMAYQFPADYDTIVGNVVDSFSCENRPYGYYADVDNNCQIFHICLPIPNDAGDIIDTYHYSFLCGNQTIFDQETLTCNHPQNAFPCDQAASLYDLKNSEFGRIEDYDF